MTIKVRITVETISLIDEGEHKTTYIKIGDDQYYDIYEDLEGLSARKRTSADVLFAWSNYLNIQDLLGKWILNEPSTCNPRVFELEC